MLLNVLSFLLYLLSHILLATALGLLATRLRFSAVPKISLFFAGAATTPFVFGCITLLILCIPVQLPSIIYVLVPMILSCTVLFFNRALIRTIPERIKRVSVVTKLLGVGSVTLFPALVASSAFIVYLRLHWSVGHWLILGLACSALFVALAYLVTRSYWKQILKNKRWIALFVAFGLVAVPVSLVLLVGVWQVLKLNLILVAGGLILLGLLAFAASRVLPLLGLAAAKAKRVAAYYGALSGGALLLRACVQLVLSIDVNTNKRIAIVAVGCVLLAGLIALVLYLAERTIAKRETGDTAKIGFAAYARRFARGAMLFFCALVLLSAGADIAMRAITPVTGADAMEYMTSAYGIANGRTLASVSSYNGSEDGSQIGIVHHPAWTAYLAQALMHSPGTPQAYPQDLAARSTYALTYVYLFVAVFALARAFLPNRFALLAAALASYTPHLGYLIAGNSREGFRIIPILLLILVLYGYASAVSERRRVHWPELIAVFLVAAFTMMGHVLNGIPALAIGLAILAYCLISRNFHWNTIWMAVAAGLGGIFGSIQILLGYLERGQLLSDFISLDSILAGTPYLENFYQHQGNRLGDTTTYLDRLNVIVRYDHGLLTIVGIAVGIWFIVRMIKAIKKGAPGEITGFLGLVGLFFALLFTDLFRWSGYTLTEWSIMNIRYISHLYPVYSVLVAGGLYALDRIKIQAALRQMAVSALLCGYAAYLFANVGFTYPLENMPANYADVPNNYTAAYQAHEAYSGRLMVDNYYCNYYFHNEAMTFFSEKAIDIRRAQTVPELSAALDKHGIDAILISDQFVSVYWQNTILLELVVSGDYQMTDYEFFKIYQKVAPVS